MGSALREWLEAMAAGLFFRMFGGLPLDWASAVGGWIGRVVGPLLPVSGVARRNLLRVFPDWTEAERRRTIRRMWDHLGRVAGEYPHLPEFRFGPGERVQIEGGEVLDLLRDDEKPGLFFGAHLGNWELMAFSIIHHGLRGGIIYRAASNRRVNWLFTRGRDSIGLELIPKGARGARQALELLKQGGHLGMLVDQKMNDGISVPFFGIDAMTPPALASFALKFGCPVVPTRVLRTKGAHYRVIFDKPWHFAASDDRQADMLSAMTRVNQVLEGWIRQNPEQWLWLHKRWPG